MTISGTPVAANLVTAQDEPQERWQRSESTAAIAHGSRRDSTRRLTSVPPFSAGADDAPRGRIGRRAGG
jgi:hypothetical protein